MAQDYSVALTNTDGVVFPDTTAINATGPSTTDGTEYVKVLIDDIWGRSQAILNHAGLTPDGVTEADGTAQVIEALQKGFGAAPGIIQEWNLAADPGTTGHRALLIQGQGILHANYLDLLAAVYVGDGNNAAVAAGGGFYYKATDAAGASPSTSGTYLIMPDGRGVVPRGLDVAAAIDPDGASRYVGDLQIDAGQGHWHAVRTTTVDDSFSATANTSAGAGERLIASAADPLVAKEAITDGVNGTPRTDSETRMYNRSTRYVIWY